MAKSGITNLLEQIVLLGPPGGKSVMRNNKKLFGAVCVLALGIAATCGIALARSHRADATTPATPVAVVPVQSPAVIPTVAPAAEQPVAMFDPDGTDILSAIGPINHEVVVPAAPTEFVVNVEKSWRDEAHALTCRDGKKARYIRIDYKADGSPEAMKLFETVSMRNPFTRVECASCPAAKVVVAQLGDAVAANVDYDDAGWPIRFHPFRE